MGEIKIIPDYQWIEAYEDMQIRKKMVQAQCESCWTKNAELGLLALEKQIPKKTNYNQGIRCSECGGIVTPRYSYCPHCGQRLKLY